MSHLPRPLAPLVLALSIFLAACAGTGGSGEPIQHPEGDALVLRVTNEGGFVPIQFFFTNFPSFSLLGDGRLVVPGAQIEIYPGPALPAANLRTLTPEGIQAVLREVEATGLFGADAQYLGGQNFVADAQDTVFTLHAGGREVTVRVYALGIVAEGDSHPGISAAELAAHVALGHLLERLTNLDAWLPASAWADAAWSAYQPDAMRLLVRNADADQPDQSGIESQLRPWPASEDPATFGAATSDAMDGARCGVVAGADAALWYEVLGSSNQLTRFTHAGHKYAVQVRFFLPDEPLDCPQVGY